MDKKRIIAFLIFFILPLGTSAFYFPATSKNTNIVITEIGAFEKRSNDCEWIEIYNRSSTSLNIKDWKLWEQQSNHKIETSENTDSYEIAPQEYAVLADRPQSLLSNNNSTCKHNYNIPTSTPIFATDFSYGLKNGGEEIALKRSNSFSDVVEKFTYKQLPNNTSLERISPKKLDYTEDNWKLLSPNTTPNHTLSNENYHHNTEGKIEKFNPDVNLISSSSIAKQVSTTFSASSSQVKEFEWNFVNKNKAKANRNNQQIQSTEATVQYSFDQSGEYIVNLLNYDQQGAVASTNTSIAISNPPTANITAPTSTKTHTSTLVSGKNSSSSPLTEITSYLWNFNESANSSSSTGVTTTYNYTNTGTYNINLKIEDDNLGSDKTSSSIRVLPNSTNTGSNSKPEIIASSIAKVDEKVKFKADPINSSTNYFWNINQSSARGVTTTYTFNNTSTYKILLTASSTDYKATDTHKIKITEKDSAASSPTTTISTSSDKIVINEILPNPNSGNEWIELYNPEQETIDLTGWTLSDEVGTIASLDQTISSSDFLTHTLSSAKLNNGGDSVILKNKNNKIINQLEYDDSTISASIPETGNSIARSITEKKSNNDKNNFIETTQPTKNKENKISKPSSNPSSNLNNEEEESEEDTEFHENDTNHTQTNSNSSQEEVESDVTQNYTSFDKSDLLINELLTDPKDTKEFVEIYNNTDQKISLTDWKLEDGAENKIKLNGEVPPNGYRVFENKSSYLNNNGDLLELISPKNKTIDDIIYGDWDTSKNNLAPKSPEGKSLSRVKNNKDTDNYKKDFEITTVTKGKKNLSSKTETTEASTFNTSSNKLKPRLELKAPKSVQVGETVTFSAKLSSNYSSNNLIWMINTDNIAENKTEVKHTFKEEGLYTIIAKIKKGGKEITNAAKKVRAKNKTSSAVGGYIPTEKLDKVKINETLPNPQRSDKKEFIELFNPTTKPIPLGEAQIDDEEGGSKPYQFSTTTVMKPKTYFVLPKKKTGISLNNSGDEVRILTKQGGLITKIKYQQAPEGRSFDGKVWSKIQTPGFKNKILRQKSNPNSTQQTVNKTGFKKVSLKKISNMQEGDKIITTGIVTVAPHKLKDRVFYIQGSPGLQIYNHNKDFPSLDPGDKVEIKGELSQAYGHWRLKTEDKKSIKKIEHIGTPNPEKIQAEEIDNNLTSRLVQLQGEITEKNRDQFYLDDKSGEIEVEIKDKTGISLKGLSKKDLAKVSGIVSKRGDEYKILPRKESDIEKTGTSKANQKTETSTQISSEDVTEKYLIATAGAIIVILITLLLKEKQKG